VSRRGSGCDFCYKISKMWPALCRRPPSSLEGRLGARDLLLVVASSPEGRLGALLSFFSLLLVSVKNPRPPSVFLFSFLFFLFSFFLAVAMEEVFYSAAKDGKTSEVEEILRGNPTLDVNWGGGSWRCFTALHEACFNDDHSTVSLPLAHPGIDVNRGDDTRYTPFLIACFGGNTSCVRLLLKDPRVQVNEPNEGGLTPLRVAAYLGRLDAVRWWMASGREMDLGVPGEWRTDAIGQGNLG